MRIWIHSHREALKAPESRPRAFLEGNLLTRGSVQGRLRSASVSSLQFRDPLRDRAGNSAQEETQLPAPSAETGLFSGRFCGHA